MKKITNKKAEEIATRINRSNDYYLTDVYNSYSTEKAKAYNYCIDLYHHLDGSNFRIIGANSSFFSVGFFFINEHGKNCVAYITHCNDYYGELED